ncbi:DUF6932 family protein [Chromobacterium haemolyticum]|uniref:DUF6932 family protein n=1 Tax=Chromobacterium haemolyticum TaxID=394935 RepID=UPI001AD81D83|nr:hypothetical protein [Chromobacterium haemolyticum]
MIEVSDAPWKVLPPGIHTATLQEIENFFAINNERRAIFNGLYAAAKALADAGCQKLYIDGSYVTGKPIPGDFDGCWVPDGVDPNKLDPVLLDFGCGRKNQKSKYLGELFIEGIEGQSGLPFSTFFQREKHSGKQKGILTVDLQNEQFL